MSRIRGLLFSRSLYCQDSKLKKEECTLLPPWWPWRPCGRSWKLWWQKVLHCQRIRGRWFWFGFDSILLLWSDLNNYFSTSFRGKVALWCYWTGQVCLLRQHTDGAQVRGWWKSMDGALSEVANRGCCDREGLRTALGVVVHHLSYSLQNKLRICFALMGI